MVDIPIRISLTGIIDGSRMQTVMAYPTDEK
jgi:hypothetical protein